ncbi:MAG: hypothetical protein WBD41_15930 [Rhodococcus sp. (in: high G+C Gram-positive bacteria)]
MTGTQRALAHLTLFVGAFAAVWALTTTVSRNFAFVAGGDRLDVLFDSQVSAAALGAIVAVVVATAAQRSQMALAAGGLGIVVLAIASVMMYTGQLQLRGIAGGLILGGCAALAGERRTLQCALVFGALSGMVTVGPVEQTRSSQTPLLFILGVLAILLIAALWTRVFGELPVRTWGTGRMVLVGTVVPIAGLVLYWLFVRAVNSLGSVGAMQGRWLLGLAVIPLLVGAAFALRGMTGAVILAALAFLAATALDSLTMSTALLFVALLLSGIVIGWRRPSPLLAFALLAVVAATGVFVAQFDVVNLVLPFAVGLAYASLLPTNAPAVTIAVTTPIVVTVPIVAEYGWTAYTPLTSVEPSSWTWTSTAVSVGSILAAAVALVVLRRRPVPRS